MPLPGEKKLKKFCRGGIALTPFVHQPENEAACISVPQAAKVLATPVHCRNVYLSRGSACTPTIFSRGGQWGGWKTEVPIGVQGQLSDEDLGTRIWQLFLKMMYKYFVYWDFRQHLQHVKHFKHFQRGRGQVPTPGHACGRPCSSAWLVL